ncbi:tRNA (guanosine(37)-N1)-methyltransferase TrmD [Candidatus Gracilibacteria bacterium]|nr:tRNA (guanosine(37)-N1)-methyltransferase TrmD [Candidatus Gracilibacteria bacterium]MCF7856513.1 tRNA (guanosine(37)-N1)-methyltransferase TrmD [Candidatus Gracilibacteria bacterium]MCF7896591.1 tRNA (guanosine(37)-N1)-methyltransferase TrmD [Candidatus Gracilibacteria bacterium]
MLRIDIITIFPESFESTLKSSILARAIRLKKIQIKLHQLRDFAKNKWRKVDDRPFGGGAGMVLTCQPLFDAVKKIRGRSSKKIPVIYFTPRGKKFDQPIAEKFAEKFERIILVCGHYEGVDQRFIDSLVDFEISLGDFVLTGGELPALVFVDAVARLIPGVVGKIASVEEESFSEKLNRKKEYPHYTRPENFRGLKIPKVLLGGNHAQIRTWRIRKTE